MASFEGHYEGCGKDEIFVGNQSANSKCHDLNANGIKYRIGEIALDIHGEKLSPNYMRPLFVKKESYKKYNDMMQAQLESIRRS